MLKPDFDEFDLEDRLILYAYRGSIAHNLYVPPEEENSTDDVDMIGVFVAPIDYYLGLPRKESIEIKQGIEDIVLYDVIKFVRLLIKGNPNAISVLWNIPEMYIELEISGKTLLENRKLFSAKTPVYKAFMGYSKSQLHKMVTQSYQGYMGAKRKALADKYGYDVKNASHLIRLLKMCSEFLQTGEMKVYRDVDRQELLDIKQGKWTLKHIEEYAKQLENENLIAYNNSELPEYADTDKINDLLVKIGLREFHRIRI